jgi:hypothetical protein
MSWRKYVGRLSPSPAAIPNRANPSGLAATTTNAASPIEVITW